MLRRLHTSLVQNNNERLNASVWAIAPKTFSCGKTIINIAIDIAVCNFNDGLTSLAIIQVLFKNLLNKLAPMLISIENRGRPIIPPHIQLLAVLWLLATPDSYRSGGRNKRNFFSHNEYILGDKAYPVLSWCIPPYIDRGNLTPLQISFNKNVSKMRQVIERAFALLKDRFRRDENNTDFIEEGQEDAEIPDNNPEHCENIRDGRNDPTGLVKRDYLCHLIT
ncbi:hypothetical protein ALC57_18376 [Trachymyrmex cornetzi]|uniref:DDE Tnp4 domain-containing protein n=1 Tax=Trachymyrmex cornetzi TaxID=471704 RepID=A0A151IRZ4_9HYME|nr:hypothetical protein ALC57_18376 [Trachymyrmex cornetzi]